MCLGPPTHLGFLSLQEIWDEGQVLRITRGRWKESNLAGLWAIPVFQLAPDNPLSLALHKADKNYGETVMYPLGTSIDEALHAEFRQGRGTAPALR